MNWEKSKSLTPAGLYDKKSRRHRIRNIHIGFKNYNGRNLLPGITTKQKETGRQVKFKQGILLTSGGQGVKKEGLK